MTLRKLQLQARYDVLTPAALIGLSSALLLSAAPAFAAAQTNTATNATSILVGPNNAFTNTGTITSDGTNPAVYSNSDVESIFNAAGASIVGGLHNGIFVNGNVTDAVTNNGTVSAMGSTYGVFITGMANAFTNTGTITAGYTGVVIGSGVDSFTNSGTIDSDAGAGVGIYSGSVNSFVNTSTGSISGTWAGVAIYGGVSSFLNAGTIIADDYTLYIGTNNSTLVNSGTIIARTWGAAYIYGSNNTLVNSGKIAGDDYSVYFDTGSGNTLKVLTSGTFIGAVHFNSGTDMFDFSQYHGNMILEEGGTLANGNVVPGENLYLQTATQVIVVGDSSVTNSSNPVSDITTGINTLLNDQLDVETGGGDGGESGALGFAPVRVNSAAEMATAKAIAPRSNGGQVFWAQGIGGGSSNGVDASDVFGALVVGTHAQLQDGFSIGGLGAYAHSIATTDGSQTITADTGIIGAYGRADLDTISLDFSILAGASSNASARTVAGPGGPETASASFGGWFIDPTIGISVPVLSSDKGDLSLTGTVGYLLGGFGGYTETGSSANLTVGAQTIGILDAAFGVKGRKDLGSNEHGIIVGKGTAELFAQSNMGSSTVPISVLGTTIGNALPPTALALGVRSSLSVEMPISDNASFTGGGSVSLRSDGLISGAATAKISGTF